MASACQRSLIATLGFFSPRLAFTAFRPPHWRRIFPSTKWLTRAGVKISKGSRDTLEEGALTVTSKLF